MLVQVFACLLSPCSHRPTSGRARADAGPMASADCLRFVFTRVAEREKGAKPMSNSHHLEFTRSFLEACTDLKLVDLLQDILRERPEDHRDLHAVSEELEKRQKKAQEGPMSDHPADAPALFPLPPHPRPRS